MRRPVRQAESVGQRGQLAIAHLFAHEAAGQGAGVDDAIGQGTVTVPAQVGVEEPQIETDVMADHDGVAEELDQRGEERVDRRRRRHHRLRDAGQVGDEGRDGDTGVDERLEGPEGDHVAGGLYHRASHLRWLSNMASCNGPSTCTQRVPWILSTSA